MNISLLQIHAVNNSIVITATHIPPVYNPVPMLAYFIEPPVAFAMFIFHYTVNIALLH